MGVRPVGAQKGSIGRQPVTVCSMPRLSCTVSGAENGCGLERRHQVQNRTHRHRTRQTRQPADHSRPADYRLRRASSFGGGHKRGRNPDRLSGTRNRRHPRLPRLCRRPRAQHCDAAGAVKLDALALGVVRHDRFSLVATTLYAFTLCVMNCAGRIELSRTFEVHT